MFLHEFEKLCAIGESMNVKLPRRGLKLDPRVNRTALFYPLIQIRFDCDYHDDGITVTLTRVSLDKYHDRRQRNVDDTHARRSFTMRVFDPQTEVVPDFTSTIYVYYGLHGEMPPLDTTEIIIHHSVKTIRRHAFSSCHKIERCKFTMHDQVEIIEERAFARCTLLGAIFLPSSIKKIERGAFSGCRSMRIFSIPIPMHVHHVEGMKMEIQDKILQGCHTFFHRNEIELQRYLDTSGNNNNQLHICSIDNDEIHVEARHHCTESKSKLDIRDDDCLLRRCFSSSFAKIFHMNNYKKRKQYIEAIINKTNNTKLLVLLQEYHRRRKNNTDNNKETIHKAIIDFHLNLPPLHKVCLDTNIPAQAIYECIVSHGKRAAYNTAYGDMTPMQVLVLNPHATTGAIMELFQVNMGAVFERYACDHRTYRGDVGGDGDDIRTCKSPLDRMTPMDYLLRYNNVDSYMSVIRVLCIHWTNHERVQKVK